MRLPGGQNGFTLIELVVAVSLFTLVVGAALTMYQIGIHAWQRAESGADVQENLRLGLDRMSRELRTATALRNVEAGSIEFDTAYNKTVRYYRYPKKNQLMRFAKDVGSTQGGSNPLASYVTGLAFKYYDKEGKESGDPEKITLVSITLEGKKGDLNPLKLSTSVRIRARE
jgi:prepilin-type N-terminal cleavage/methylation domain-containing protein